MLAFPGHQALLWVYAPLLAHPVSPPSPTVCLHLLWTLAPLSPLVLPIRATVYLVSSCKHSELPPQGGHLCRSGTWFCLFPPWLTGTSTAALLANNGGLFTNLPCASVCLIFTLTLWSLCSISLILPYSCRTSRESDFSPSSA